MDRRRRRAAILAVGLAGAASFALAADAPPTLRAMRWLAPGADPVRTLGAQPVECLRTPASPADAVTVEIGRAAFRSPLVLGGQAARAGLSCESCHRNGRGNPDFLFPGVSGPPGTADVTHALFSARRGNGVHDPKPIPDLGGPRDRLKVADPDLPGFLHGLVVEEFDGREPPPAVLAGLAAYVRHLDPAACPAGTATPVTLAGLLADTRRALNAALSALHADDPATAAVMVAAARARLGLVHERFAGMEPEQDRLRAADLALSQAQEAARTGAPDAADRLAGWLAASGKLEQALAAKQGRSLFDPDRLAAPANRRLPRKAS